MSEYRSKNCFHLNSRQPNHCSMENGYCVACKKHIYTQYAEKWDEIANKFGYKDPTNEQETQQKSTSLFGSSSSSSEGFGLFD
ncbi:hypothetical protein M0813_14370 [Anaeramoeba flamelloides]|uniref:Uncharacterized protein n=1 Tax=Anaeramoeba flamelloides TaxID=1746091 RepID=A0ABQ8Z660_9EUKA|nr:hypothetical protein M0813_14370 [Anaeramoeba flamelloides]